MTADGSAAGADAPPGLGASYGVIPHARLWPATGDAIDLDSGPSLSVAYALDASGRVAGMIEDADGRHHAFLWQAGHLQLLDDIAHAADWRFESAYAFAAGGAIVGIGVYREKATAFVLEHAASNVCPSSRSTPAGDGRAHGLRVRLPVGLRGDRASHRRPIAQQT